MEGWIKLHRKVLDNGILKDSTAWVIFSWLMLKVDRKTGKKTIGRFWASDELGLKPTTFYQALKRLEKKWKVLTQSSNNRFTEISLVNWGKYQVNDTSIDNRLTTDRQQIDTLQEVKNKEVKNNITAKAEKNINHPYRDIINYCKEKQKLSNGFVNYAKQTTAVKKILTAGYKIDDIRFVIDEMSNEPFWQGSPFDLMSVSNQMHKYMNRTVFYKKGGGKNAEYQNDNGGV